MSLFPPLTTSPSMASSDSEKFPVRNDNGKPYFGMTGTELNTWVTVACTTAMALFGNLLFLLRRSGYVNNFVFTTGYDQGVFGGIIVTPDFLEQMGNPDPTLQGTIVSLYDIGWYVPLYTSYITPVFVLTFSPQFLGCYVHIRIW